MQVVDALRTASGKKKTYVGSVPGKFPAAALARILIIREGRRGTVALRSKSGVPVG